MASGGRTTPADQTAGTAEWGEPSSAGFWSARGNAVRPIGRLLRTIGMNPPGATPARRKADHLRIAAAEDVQHREGTGLDRVRLRHRALPGRDLADVDLRATVLGRPLEAPLLISAMTGGTDEAESINGRLIRAAADHGIGLVLGSGRRLLDEPALLRTYRPAPAERPPLLFANLGAVQTSGRGGADRAERLVSMLDADGLSIHLNPLQEAIQPEGEPHFGRVLDGIAEAVERLGRCR